MKRVTVLLLLVVSTASLAADDTQRCVISMGVPSYPRLAQQARIEGTVKVGVTIDEAGTVVKATAVSGHRMLQDASEANAKTWRFTASTSGKSSVLLITYEYRIEGQEVELNAVRCPKVKLDLPERVEVSSPPIIVKTESAY